MGRLRRQGSSVGLYHIITRGNNKTQLFHKNEDFDEYLTIVKASLHSLPISIYHYCLMNNHTHMLIGSPELKEIGRFMHKIQRSYHHYYRKNYTWFGHLFQGRYRSLAIEDEGYLLDCGRYIERNPVRAKMVKKPEDWKYSSYRVYGYGQSDELVSISVAYKALGANEDARRELYRKRVEATRPYEEIIDRELIGT